jgi:4-hydroxythreonine-4-phosphate dehydrogenase
MDIATPPFDPSTFELSPLALTMGEPAGIGPEITLTAWQRRTADALPPFVCYADPAVLAARAATLGLAVPIAVVATPAEAVAAFADALPVIDVGPAGRVTPGRPSGVAAAATIAAIERAVADTRAGRTRAVVTNPIAKSVLYAVGFRHPGHTEYLAHLAGAAAPDAPQPTTPPTPVMMLAAAELRTVPVTVHIPLADVPRALTADLIATTIEITRAALFREFGLARPRIAVAGLNPHAGESGTLGTEDRDLIAPVIARFAAAGHDVVGPLPADTMFHAAARARYDAAVCMYHDQALIPIKTLAFDRGVNVTLGLPFVRTSPDHGTAFDIAGQGIATPTSLIEALRLADRMAVARPRVAAAETAR